MSYLVDTNVVIALMGGHPVIHARLQALPPDDVALSAIVAHELYFGLYKSHRQAENRAKLLGLNLPVLDFDRDDADHAGRVRATLARRGTPIGPYDILIAGQALARGLTLVTRNTREFARVEGLAVEDWGAS